jgi:hypothetical protein
MTCCEHTGELIFNCVGEATSDFMSLVWSTYEAYDKNHEHPPNGSRMVFRYEHRTVVYTTHGYALLSLKDAAFAFFSSCCTTHGQSFVIKTVGLFVCY